MKTALITGSAGFIGFFLSQHLLENNWRVIGIDNLNDYYDPKLKLQRQKILLRNENFSTINNDIQQKGVIRNILKDNRVDVIVHLAAQAGVRYSIENPREYLESNVVGTFEILEGVREFKVEHLLIASTSSAYGANTEMPFQENTKADHQISFYAATKKATENMAHSYSHIYNIPITMFRFFTVYGPWGRPDMALFKFTKAIYEEKELDVFNSGDMERDFTYIDDIASSIKKLIAVPPQKNSDLHKYENDSLSPVAPWRVVNIGNSRVERLGDFISQIEKCVGKKAKLNLLPMQQGDVKSTWADCSLLNNLTGYKPATTIEKGVKEFVDWYKEYYLTADTK